jgi:hypothetical protein
MPPTLIDWLISPNDFRSGFNVDADADADVEVDVADVDDVAGS